MDITGPNETSAALRSAAFRSAAWIALIAGASLGFSLAFACAMPFVALAALAGTQLRGREAALAIVLAWLGNQAVGFLLLHYPHTATTFAWGGAMLAAALTALALAAAAGGLKAHVVIRGVAAFAIGFLGYEAVLYATASLLGSGHAAFTPAIVGRILAINAVAFAGLLALYRGATALGLPAPRTGQRLAAA